MHQKRTGKQFRFHLPQQQIETLARSRVSRLSLSLSLSQETMPSLQTALPPELANNVIRVKYHFISASIKSTLVVIIQIPDFHGFKCSFTVNVFDELNILVIK
jgi:hypothetical protein